jgi:chromosome segregation ATPase
MTVTLAADLTVAVLLVITIYYAAKLSRRLSALRADKAALQTLVQSLTQASQSAEAGIRGLRSAAEESGRELQKKLQEAQGLRDDLAYMIDRGGSLADRMESSLRTRREERTSEPTRPRPVETAPRAAAAPPPRREAKSGPTNFIQEMAARLAPGGAAAPSRAERDLLRALGGRR